MGAAPGFLDRLDDMKKQNQREGLLTSIYHGQVNTPQRLNTFINSLCPDLSSAKRIGVRIGSSICHSVEDEVTNGHNVVLIAGCDSTSSKAGGVIGQVAGL